MLGDLRLRVLLFRQADDVWVAQVLEHDMAAHGPNEYAALAAVQLVLQAHVNFDTRLQRPPLSRLQAAPAEFWDAYNHAEPLRMPDETPIFQPAHIVAAVSKDPVQRAH